MSTENIKTHEGLVTRKTHGIYSVKTDENEYLCRISSKLRKQLVYPKDTNESLRRRVIDVKSISRLDPVAIGDIVKFKIAQEDERGVIEEVGPRRNYLSRLSAGRKRVEQVIAANVDQVVIVASSALPKTLPFTIDRYLAVATQAKIPTSIIVTKIDLSNLEETKSEYELYEDIGYPVTYTSSTTGVGIDEVSSILKDKTSVMLGLSGVGKSSLLNAIEPGLGIKVREVHQKTGEGMHTTTHLEMHFLESGGSIIDTPGMREFGIWRTKELDIATLFVEIGEHARTCKFGSSCKHMTEAGCGVLKALKEGKIAESRYKHYKMIDDGIDEFELAKRMR